MTALLEYLTVLLEYILEQKVIGASPSPGRAHTSYTNGERPIHGKFESQ